jgi:glycosyltransferase involved in cell wall biosynthesis
MLNHNRIWESTFNRAFYFARPLARSGHHVTVVTNSKNNILKYNVYTLNGVRIIETPDLFWGSLRTGWDFHNTLRRIFYLKSMRFDIIHAFDCRPTVILPALYLKNRLNIPLVIDWADWWGKGGAIELRKNKVLNKLFAPVEIFFEENFRKHADYTTVISHLLKDRAVRLKVDAQKIKIVFHGCDTETVLPLDKLESRKKLNLPENHFVLLFSGFVLYDIEMALNAFDTVAQKYPNTILLITGSDRPFKGLNNGKWQKNDNIVNYGFLSKDKYNLALSASNLCLLPLSDTLANRARYPGRAGDYLAAGRPIISNKVGDISNIIREHDLGVLTNPDHGSFAKGIIEALENSKICKKWEHNARSFAENVLSFDILSKEFENIYWELLEENK